VAGLLIILGIESSCDETAAAVVEDGHRVMASLVASQTEIHMPFGGVVPEVAAREHLRVIDPLVQQALNEAGVKFADLDAVAITQGPGLIGALLVGVAYAKGLALALGKPLIPVDHVHAHVHGALLGVEVAARDLFPTLALVVSGGHTNLYRMGSPTEFALIASSIDDACGECFDKVAKLLGLGYPGGAEIERHAKGGNVKAVPMPRMVSERARLEFSYSGLKTFVANVVAAEQAPISAARRSDICASFQEEALGQLVRKLTEAVRRYPEARSILVAGGVAANQRLQELMRSSIALPAFFPALRYCGDNAAMIAAYGYHLARAAGDGNSWLANADWDAYSRYDFGEGKELSPGSG